MPFVVDSDRFRGAAERALHRLVRVGGVLIVGLAGCDDPSAVTSAGDGDERPDADSVPVTVDLSGDLRHVHDPVVIRAHEQYYLYSTGGGIQWRSSPNQTAWTYRGNVLGGVPEWAEEITEGDLWAPDITHSNGRYYLYYSASTFGSGRSAIGVATNPVLSPDSSGYGWTDRGKVIESFIPDSYNAIDPNIVIDGKDRVWMAFGSWNDTGIRMRRIDSATGMPSNEDDTFYSLANRPTADENAIEAPYVIRRDGWYYLFVSFDDCCQGVGSDYNIRVGRSDSVTGPYVDREGIPMTEGGGTLVLEGWSEWRGPGHNAVIEDGGETFLVYHAYSVAEDGTPFLQVSPLEWKNGRPFVPRTERD